MATMFSSGEGYESLMGRHSIKLAPLFVDFAKVRDAGSILDAGRARRGVSGSVPN
jgi:hypothetical protein